MFQAGKSFGPSLVLKKFEIDESESSGRLVEVVGRTPGFIGWTLSAMGLDAQWHMVIDTACVMFRKSNIEGESIDLLPMGRVASTSCGHQKPVSYLVFAALFMIAAPVTFGLTLIVSALLVYMYFTQKNMSISVVSTGGTVLGLQFKPSVIEGVKIDIQQVTRAIDLVNRHVVTASGGEAREGHTLRSMTPVPVASAQLSTPLTPTAAPIAEQRPRFCHKCGGPVAVGDFACLGCGSQMG